MNYKLVGSTVIAAVLGGTLVASSFYVGSGGQTTVINLSIIVIGLSAGWLLGVLVSPYSQQEKATFSEYSKAFGVFASGYLVAKTDKAVETLFAPDFVFESLRGFRLLAFVAAMIIGMVTTFNFRRYG